MRDLQIAKKQTWDEKQRSSARYEEERKVNLANKVTIHLIVNVILDNMIAFKVIVSKSFTHYFEIEKNIAIYSHCIIQTRLHFTL